MSDSADARALTLRNLHVPGNPLVLANIYDPTTAEFVASHSSSTALATTSYSIAKVHGFEDDFLDLDTNLNAIRRIAPIALNYNKPLTVDMQDGYGVCLEEAIHAIIEDGVSGSVDRVRRLIVAAAEAGVPNFVLNARTDAIVINNDVDEAIRRGKAFLEAGATTAFVWGGAKRGGLTRDEVVRISDQLDGRLDVIALQRGLSVQELADIGVARISVESRLWISAYAAFLEAAKGLLGEYEAMKASRK
ncbi:hypothetical protein ACO22_03460 [Paracoccidioides brasiliensis]|uniref:Uncharacterized protein n=1 Tax=Paracoccidioides brasiliensis TaxID=121759 RepID=A0A1D2JFV0_PARBR|nr:hypothetical protein ACO22_03460 [Paracoccidioides brasiliensis]